MLPLRLLHIPKHRRRTAQVPGDITPPRPGRNILAQWNVRHIVETFELDLLGDSFLFAWIGTVDPGNGNFKRLFAELAERAQGANS